MSWQATKWALREAPVDGLSPAKRLVLHDLAERANDHGDGKQTAWPSVGGRKNERPDAKGSIAAETGLSRRAVQYGLEALDEAGLIERTKRTRGTTVYTLLLSKKKGEDSAPVHTVHPTDAHGAPVRCTQCNAGVQTTTPRGAHGAPEPIREPIREPEENAQDARASDSEGEEVVDGEIVDAIDEEVDELCDHLADEIAAHGVPRPVPDRKWRDAARGMLFEDGLDFDDIKRLITWVQRNDFWSPNVLEMSTLRDKWTRLKLESKRKAPSGRAGAGQRIAELELSKKRRQAEGR